MNMEDEKVVTQALILRARGGDADAARILFNEKSKQIRPVRFHECESFDELKVEFERYMAQPDITKAESEHAAKTFDRLFKVITARDEARRNDVKRIAVSGLLMVPVIDPAQWGEIAEKSQRELKAFARE